MELKTGIKGRAETAAAEENTAKSVGSGELPVFATPCMLALMEKAAAESVAPFLDEGQSSVGTRAEFTHDAATPVGMKVFAESELISVDGRKLTFKVEAFDESGKIGGGIHERFIISADKFVKKTYEKLK